MGDRTNPFPKLTELAKQGKLDERTLRELQEYFAVRASVKPKSKDYGDLRFEIGKGDTKEK